MAGAVAGDRALIQQLALVLFDDSNQTHHQSQRGTQTLLCQWRRTSNVVVAVVSAAVTLQFAAACSKACHNRERGRVQGGTCHIYISHNERFMQETVHFAAVNLLVGHGKCCA